MIGGSKGTTADDIEGLQRRRPRKGRTENPNEATADFSPSGVWALKLKAKRRAKADGAGALILEAND